MRIAKWGNSLAVRLPKSVVDNLGLKPGDELELVSAQPRPAYRDQGQAQGAGHRADAQACAEPARRLLVRPKRSQRQVTAFLDTNLLVYAQTADPKGE